VKVSVDRYGYGMNFMDEELLKEILLLENKGYLSDQERRRVRTIMRDVKLKYDRVPKELAEPLGRIRRTSLITFNIYSKNVGFLFGILALIAGMLLNFFWLFNFVENVFFLQFFYTFNELIRLLDVYFFEEVFFWLLGQNFFAFLLTYLLGLGLWTASAITTMAGIRVFVHYYVLKKIYNVEPFFWIHKLEPCWVENYAQFLQIGFKGRRMCYLTGGLTGVIYMIIICAITTLINPNFWTVWLIFAVFYIFNALYVFVYHGEYSDWARYFKETELQKQYLKQNSHNFQKDNLK